MTPAEHSVLQSEKIDILNEKLGKKALQISTCKKELRELKSENLRLTTQLELLQEMLAASESEKNNYVEQMRHPNKSDDSRKHTAQTSSFEHTDAEWKLDILKELVLYMKTKELNH